MDPLSSSGADGVIPAATELASVWFPAALACLIAGVITTILVPFVVKLAPVLRAVDVPGDRRLHAGAIPRLGGLAMGGGLAFGAGAVALMQWNIWGARVHRSELAAVLIACGMVFVVGMMDDLVGVTIPKKLVVELAAAALIVGVGWGFTLLGLPGGRNLDLGAGGAVLTVIWIVGVTNAINLIDGLDGLATGVVAIVAGSLLCYSVAQENFFTAVLLAAVVGACAGFLRHNWAPAQIFMGDAGSLTLGFILAVVSVHSSLKSSAAVAILIPILALGVPVIDTLLVMLIRFVERSQSGVAGRLLRIFTADRNHLHHLMERHGASRGTVVRVIYVLVLISCAMALMVGLTKHPGLGMALVIVEIGAIVAVRSLGFAGQAKLLSLGRRKELREEVLSGVSEGEAGKAP